MNLGMPPVARAPSQPQSPGRSRFIGFVNDKASAALLHEVLEPVFPKGNELHVVGFRTALDLLSAMKTPEIVLIDLSGEMQPLNAMLDLAQVVEPGTAILAIGESRDMSFYRAVTRGMGVREYLQKPLTRENVESHFLTWMKPDQGAAAQPRGGKLISVAGVRGGVGCSTLAANLAWVIGAQMRRHTVLLDSDLYTGTAALTLNVQPTTGLRTALEAPDRVDQLLIERAAQPAAERLHVLAAAEPLNSAAEYAEGAAAMLCQGLTMRYNFVIADVGARQLPFARDLQYLAQQKVVVVDPTMLAIRNFEKISLLPRSPLQSPRQILVLNHAGRPGGLAQNEVEQALGLSFHAVIPDLPRQLFKAAHLGEPAASRKGPFRDAILRIARAIGASPGGEAAAA
jgi:pilus assembly protein CpaE